MPALDGAGVVEQVRARYPDARLVILTTYDADDDVERALRAGAKAYLLKDVDPQELVACVRAVHAGRSWVSPAIAAKLAERLTRVELTPREMGVLRELVTGKSNKEIAAALGIVEGTVKLHVTRLYEKLGVSNRTEALAVAVRRGLVRLP
jgi:DNA-binding NarL/FixJ family response regulator